MASYKTLRMFGYFMIFVVVILILFCTIIFHKSDDENYKKHKKEMKQRHKKQRKKIKELERKKQKVDNRDSEDEEGRLHCEDKKALEYPDGWGVYSWHGVRVPDFVIEKPGGTKVHYKRFSDGEKKIEAVL